MRSSPIGVQIRHLIIIQPQVKKQTQSAPIGVQVQHYKSAQSKHKRKAHPSEFKSGI